MIRTARQIELGPSTTLAPEGLVMIATGAQYRQEARASALQSRPWIGGRPLLLITDELPVSLPEFDYVAFHPSPSGSYRDKIAPLSVLPFERSLFLDTDACLVRGIDDVFALLQTFDLCACHAPVRFHAWRDLAVPEGFCEVNTGMLALHRNPATLVLIKSWLAVYDRIGVNVDQASFRTALWEQVKQGLRLYILPPEYNLRTTKPWLVGRGLAVKVIHGRVSQARRRHLISYLNSNIGYFRSSSVFSGMANEFVRVDHSLSRYLAWLRQLLR